MEKHLHSLYKVSKALNQKKIVWGLGGSQNLAFHELLTKVGDLDIFVEEKDFFKALNVLAPLSTILKEKQPTSRYFSKHCCELLIDGIGVDLMAVFKVMEDQNSFTLAFDENRIGQHILLKDEKIPLMALEDWWVLYWMLGRENKAVLIENKWVISNGFNHKIFRGILQQNIPDWLKKRGEDLLSKIED